MKYLATLLVIMAALAALAIASSADPITATGRSQRDMYNYLVEVQTLANANKTAINKNFVLLSTVNYRLMHAPSFAVMTGTKINAATGGRSTATSLDITNP